MEAERTNGETLIWVQSLKGYGQATLKSAKSFMHFDGDCRQLKSWKRRVKMGQKQEQIAGAATEILERNNVWETLRKMKCQLQK